MPDDDLLDELFHRCAWLAFFEELNSSGGLPDSEATRKRAFRIYEDALREKNASSQGKIMPSP